MAKIKSELKDVGRIPMATGTVMISAAAELSPDGTTGITFDGTVYEKVNAGVFLSRQLAPGHARVEIVSSTKQYGPYDVVIPNDEAEHNVWDLIAQYVPQPPLVVSQAATYASEAKAARDEAAEILAEIGSGGGGGSGPGLVVDSSREGFFTIPSGSSITEDPSRPGVFLIGA